LLVGVLSKEEMGSRVDLLYISLSTGRPNNENFADNAVAFTQRAFF